MPSVVDYVKVGLILFVLGTLTSAFGSLLLAGVFKTEGVKYAITVFTVIFAAVSIFLALFRNDSQLNKTTLWFLAIIELVAAVATPVIPYNFHDNSGYLNRVVVYFIIEIALTSGLASLWRFPTLLFSGELFEAAGVDKPQETLLYVLWGVLSAFLVSWFLPLKETYQRGTMFEFAVKYTVGFYIVSGLLAAGLGILILIKGGAGSIGASSAPAIASGGTSEYEKVG